MECDVIVIGSGPGASVAALECAKSGNKVIVVEKSCFIHPQDLHSNELDAFDTFAVRGGVLASGYNEFIILFLEDAGINIMAGSSWGGGSTINWCASLTTPDHVCQEWSAMGLTDFASKTYKQALSIACKSIGVSLENIKHKI